MRLPTLALLGFLIASTCWAGDVPEGVLQERTFPIEATFFEKLAAVFPGTSNMTVDAQSLKAGLSKLGVSWPLGSSVTYDLTRPELVVRNTEGNLALLDKALIQQRDVIPGQVEIDLLFVQFDTTNLVHMAPGSITAKSLLHAWTNGCGQLLGAPRLVTRSGSEASVRGVTETIYPTSFTQPDGTQYCVSNTLPPGATGVVAATEFQTREVGAILTVLPEVSPDGNMINLTLTPSYVGPPTWKDFGYDWPEADGRSRHVPNEQPFFYAYTVNTQVSVADGATVLIGGGMPSRDGKGLIYSFVTVRLVGPDGEPVRKGGGGARDSGGH